MPKLTLSLACAPYDRVQPLFDGRIEIANCIIEPHPMPADDVFARAYTTQEFDISELSACSHFMMSARGSSPYVGIPAFVSRCFRHSSIYVRTDRGITSPFDLKGKCVGIPQYQQTAALWIRGMLADEYGVDAHDISWRSGGLDEPGGGERTPIALRGIDLQAIPMTTTLSDMLENGRLDAVISARPPVCFLRKAPSVARLFPNFRKAEENYFRQAGVFPIMHLIGARKALVDANPWLPGVIFDAFAAAREVAMRQLRYQGASYTMLPWIPDDLDRVQALMGVDFWTYGVNANRREIDAMRRWMVEQGLTDKEPMLDQIFARDFVETDAIPEGDATR